MNIKQKMMAAMEDQMTIDRDVWIERMLDKALSVAADPANWSDDMDELLPKAASKIGFLDGLLHIKGLPS